MGRRLRYEDGVLVLILCAVSVPAVIALALTWTGDLDAKSKWTLTLAIVVGSGGFTAAALARAVRPVQTIGNLIAALRERDYAVRGRIGRNDDALGLALSELAQLAADLRDERHRDEEAAAGLARVVEGLDVAVLAIDRGGVARIGNRAAERLLGRVDVIGADTGTLGIAELLTGEVPRTVRLGAGGPWEVRRSEVRLSGVPHTLLVLTDVHRALRAEEREAWRRLVRVLGHEINNSLGPIRSIAETLRLALGRTPRADDHEEDLARGLAVIERRADALARFMTSYARLARLPAPTLRRVNVAAWVERTVRLETRLPIATGSGAGEPRRPRQASPGASAITLSGPADVAVSGDGDQLDQLLINLVANAVDAALEGGGGVSIRWARHGDVVEIAVEDDGLGLADTANLFVPFFTTKPGGSGIGLVLARQIAEAHGGALTLRNRDDARGCVAVVTLRYDPSVS